jgi:hypothetical protein
VSDSGDALGFSRARQTFDASRCALKIAFMPDWKRSIRTR